MKMFMLEKKFQSSVAMIGVVVREIIDCTKKHNILPGISEDEFRLVIDEVVTNAMEHGNAFDPEKSIYVSVMLEPPHLFISVRDEGAGFDNRSVLKSRSSGTRGNGLKLVKAFCGVLLHPEDKMVTLQVPCESTVNAV